MTDVQAMRESVMKLYPGPGWKQKVKSMPDRQVIAIFHREANKRVEAEAKARAEKRRAARTGQPPANDEIPF